MHLDLAPLLAAMADQQQLLAHAPLTPSQRRHHLRHGGISAPGSADPVELSACLLSWWQAHGRRDPVQKPWMFKLAGGWPEADQQLDPYGIWIAEVMLQQTQLAVALPYWRRWMAALPTWRPWPQRLSMRCG